MFPSLWKKIGVTEDPEVIVLVEMGLLTMLKGINKRV